MSSEAIATSLLTRRLLAPNPGPMTLDGTNTYVVSAPDAATVVVVDPGPLDETHLSTLAALGRIELILVTHKHADHTAGSARLTELSGAPVRALDPAQCFGEGAPLRDGELISASGTRIGVLTTPGHTADSVCFVLADDAALAPVPGEVPAEAPRSGSVLTGDTILGRGSTVIAHPDSTLGEYLDSLDRLEALGEALVLPGHGPTLPSLAEVCAQYRGHRLQRLDEVRATLSSLGVDPARLSPEAGLDETLVQRVAALVYPAVNAALLPAATAAVRAQLAHLAQPAQLAHLARRHPRSKTQ